MVIDRLAGEAAARLTGRGQGAIASARLAGDRVLSRQPDWQLFFLTVTGVGRARGGSSLSSPCDRRHILSAPVLGNIAAVSV